MFLVIHSSFNFLPPDPHVFTLLLLSFLLIFFFPHRFCFFPSLFPARSLHSFSSGLASFYSFSLSSFNLSSSPIPFPSSSVSNLLSLPFPGQSPHRSYLFFHGHAPPTQFPSCSCPSYSSRRFWHRALSLRLSLVVTVQESLTVETLQRGFNHGDTTGPSLSRRHTAAWPTTTHSHCHGCTYQANDQPDIIAPPSEVAEERRDERNDRVVHENAEKTHLERETF